MSLDDLCAVPQLVTRGRLGAVLAETFYTLKAYGQRLPAALIAVPAGRRAVF